MGEWVRRILIGRNQYWIRYDSTSGVFTSDAFPTAVELASLMCLSEAQVISDGKYHTIDLRKPRLQAFSYYLAKLESGKALTSAQAEVVSELYYNFLKIVAQTRSPSRILVKAAKEVKGKFALEKKRGKLPWPEFIGDRVLYPAFGDESNTTTPAIWQNKVAGRCVRSLAEFVRLLGPRQIEPLEVVRRGHCS